MLANLAKSLDFLLLDEGPDFNPNDPGGGSKYGVTVPTLGDFYGRPANVEMVKDLTPAIAREVYTKIFMGPILFTDLPSGVDYRMLDIAANLGASGALKLAYEVLGLPFQGKADAAYLDAIKRRNPGEIIVLLGAAWIAKKMASAKWGLYGAGWTNRQRRADERALSMAGVTRPVAVAAPSSPKPDLVSAAAARDALNEASPVGDIVGAATIKVGSLNIVGKVVTPEQFDAHVATLKFGAWRPRIVVVHNTDVPDVAKWKEWVARGNPTFEQWLKNLAMFYQGKGWRGGPHIFIAPDGRIGLLTPLTQRGTHAPSWNDRSIGIECVGNFEREPYIGSKTESSLIAVLASLHSHIGMVPDNFVQGVSGIHFHKDDPKTDHKTCPGKNLERAKLVAAVVAAMKGDDDGGHAHDIPLPSQETDSSELADTSAQWVQAKVNEWIANHPESKLKPLAVDGILGPASKAAIKVFQKAGGLVVDGIAGPVTRLALKGV